MPEGICRRVVWRWFSYYSSHKTRFCSLSERNAEGLMEDCLFAKYLPVKGFDLSSPGVTSPKRGAKEADEDLDAQGRLGSRLAVGTRGGLETGDAKETCKEDLPSGSSQNPALK